MICRIHTDSVQVQQTAAFFMAVFSHRWCVCSRWWDIDTTHPESVLFTELQFFYILLYLNRIFYVLFLINRTLMQTFFRVVILEYCLENIEVKKAKCGTTEALWVVVKGNSREECCSLLDLISVPSLKSAVFRPNTEQSTHMVSLNVQLLF